MTYAAFFISIAFATMPRPVEAKGMPCVSIKTAVAVAGEKGAENFAKSLGYDQSWIDKARRDCFRRKDVNKPRN